jgi:hypothetical protein
MFYNINTGVFQIVVFSKKHYVVEIFCSQVLTIELQQTDK